METIISPKFRKIIQNKKKLESELNVKITNRGKEMTIQGKPIDEYFAKSVIDAINFGFSVSHALLIKKEDLLFEIINIKEHAISKNLERVRGRIIGAQGRTLKTLSHLTECFFEINDNEVGIIGEPEKIRSAQDSIISLVKGAKQSNVYKHLEKYRPGKIIDLGLKDK